MKKIKTSVIGSYPVQTNNLEFMSNYFNQKESSWNKYITNSVNDMLRARIDFISDGQTRDPFVQLFTRKLKGCRVRDRTEIIGKVEYIQPIIVDDQKFVKSFLPSDKKIIGVITGPYTLACSCVDLFYENKEKLSFDFAKALQKEVETLQKYVDLISIDEPFFSNNLPDYGKELIKIITNKISIPTRLHACGDVSKAVTGLIEMPVDILSHEFKATPKLFDVFKEYSFKQNLCLGSVRSDNTRVESVEEIKEHIEKALNIFGDNIDQISPDCGQRLLPRDVAFQKLQNLVKAGEMING